MVEGVVGMSASERERAYLVRQALEARLSQGGSVGTAQRGSAGVKRLQAPGRFGGIAAAIFRSMPGQSRNFAEEFPAVARVGDQLSIEVLRVPVDQHAAQIKNNCSF